MSREVVSMADPRQGNEGDDRSSSNFCWDSHEMLNIFHSMYAYFSHGVRRDLIVKKFERRLKNSKMLRKLVRDNAKEKGIKWSVRRNFLLRLKAIAILQAKQVKFAYFFDDLTPAQEKKTLKFGIELRYVWNTSYFMLLNTKKSYLLMNLRCSINIRSLCRL